MSGTKKYTFYFEIFGMKKRWSTQANSQDHADSLFHAFLTKSATIIKVDAPEAGKACSNSTGDEWSKFMKSMFGSKYDNIFG